MQTTWQKNLKSEKKYPTLDQSMGADVVIVGGGISGITAAYLLAKSGKKPVVLEKGTLEESSTTAYTTAFLTYDIDTRLTDLVRIFGKKNGENVWRAGRDAIDSIEKIIEEEKIECEFERVPGYLFAAKPSEWKSVREEGAAGGDAGFPLEIKQQGSELPFQNDGYVIFPGQAKFHPLKYCQGLRTAAEKHGATFFENTEAIKTEGEKMITVHTAGGKVTAPWLIIGSYKPFENPWPLFGHKGIYTSYVVELSIPKGALPEGLYQDGNNPYHYFRVDKMGEHDRLILGGEDHRAELKMDPEKNYQALLEYAEKQLGIKKYSVVTKWDGGVLESIDGLPFIGMYSKKQPNRLVATAFSGNGMTYSMVAGKILTQYILGRKDTYAKTFDAKREYSVTAFGIKMRDYGEELFKGGLKNIFKKPEKRKKGGKE